MKRDLLEADSSFLLKWNGVINLFLTLEEEKVCFRAALD